MLPVTQTACMKLNILSSTSFCIIPSLAYVSVNRAVDFFIPICIDTPVNIVLIATDIDIDVYA